MRAAAAAGIALLTCGVLALVGATASANPDLLDFPGSIYGTLLWTRNEPPTFQARFCDGTHGGAVGLADVVVVAEPLDAAAQRALLAAPSRRTSDQELSWYDDRIVVGTSDPLGKLTIVNAAAGSRTLKILDESEVVRELVLAPDASAEVTGLPEGVLRVVAVERPGSVGWIYVTPWPSSVTNGNCRWSFAVPYGHYRVHGWHPYGGERTILYTVRKTHVPPRCPLTFGARPPGHAAAGKARPATR